MTKFEIKLHPNQIQVYNSPERFKVLICVPPGTVIPGENYNVVEHIGVGERLYGETTNNIVVNTMKNEYNGNLIDINARYILPFKVTEDHPILVSKVIRNENYYQMKMGRRDKKTITTIDETKWVSAKEVLDLYDPSDRKTKYCLHIPRFEGKYTEVIFDLENYKYVTKSSRYKNIKTLKLTEETAWLMGWFVAEGFCCGSHICYSVGKHEEHVAKEIVKKFTDLGFSSNYKEKETAIVIYVGGKKISSLFERLFSKGAENKTIPEEILLNTDINIIGSFLKGYFSGDGYFDNNRDKISAKTASVELALKIQLMCARFGWLVGIGKGFRKESTILGRTITKRPFYRIESTNHELIKIVTGIDKSQKRREYGFVYDKFILIPIEKCKSTPFSGYVYNLTTSDNTFLVSNVFTHNCGRRFGKTYLAAYSVILSALKKNNGVFFVVSPSYAQTKIIWRMIKRFLPREYIKKIMEGELYIELINGSLIFAKSGDNPESLRGEGLDGVVLDEAAFLRPEVWNEAIRPALADKMGWALIISTPKGKTWLYELFLRGLDDSQPDYKSFRFSSFDNPLVPPSEIEEMSRNLPELSYKEEILAEFIEGGGVVFRNVDKVMRGYPEEPIPGVFYIMGVDLGRHEDFTVISVARTDQNRQVYLEKFNRTDWDYIKDRVRDVHFKYNNAPIIIDSTGYGDPIYEDLGKEGLNITGININVASKPKMIENLQLMIENNMIILINDKDASLEFSAYSYTILPSGNVRYEANRGFHDDIVISTALMAMGLNGQGAGIIGEVQKEDDVPTTQIYEELEDAFDWDDDEIDISD